MQSSNPRFPSLQETVDFFTDLRAFEEQTSELVSYDIIPEDDEDRKIVQDLLENRKFSSLQENKAITSFLCLGIGDALGAHLEGQLVDYNRNIIKDFPSLDEVKHDKARPGYGLFTDDTSMALCMADSILLNNFEFNGIDMRHRFVLWWFKGYNNGRANDPKDKLSFGIGTTTMNSMMYFLKKPTHNVIPVFNYQQENNANGSIMRIAPVPIAYHDNLEKALEFARQQSWTTHNGHEAAELCKLITFLIIKFMHMNTPEECFNFLEELPKHYKSEVDSVQALIESTTEKDFSLYEGMNNNSSLDDRNWNWKDPNWKYSPRRIEKAPEFVGIYSMDNAAMSLHIIYHTRSLKDVILKAVNLGGDCDSVGAVAGAIAGAIYGYDDFVKDAYEWVKKWDEMKIALRAYKLFHKKPVS